MLANIGRSSFTCFFLLAFRADISAVPLPEGALSPNNCRDAIAPAKRVSIGSLPETGDLPDSATITSISSLKMESRRSTDLTGRLRSRSVAGTSTKT